MKIVSKAMLVEFYNNTAYQDSKPALEAWYDIAKLAKWTCPQDVKATFGNASIVGNNRVVFNIKGNDYRLIVAFAYKMGFGYVKFIGTHTQYDAVDAATVDMSQ